MSYQFIYNKRIRIKHLIFLNAWYALSLILFYAIFTVFNVSRAGWWLPVSLIVLLFIQQAFNKLRISKITIDTNTGSIILVRNTLLKEEKVESIDSADLPSNQHPSIRFIKKEKEILLTEADGFSKETLIEIHSLLKTFNPNS